MEEKTVVEQKRTNSFTWWVGMADAVVTAVVGVFMACGTIPDAIGASVIAGSAIILGYCNGNNPSIKGHY